ncbi:META domain-containing protein [Robertkochia solimangrovi]|uniref:META domain-containing protein n=1 Tax=Robertkochia solimangrovi TaxID=2213046 RepID=UPI00117C9E1C|nr:META domain-containing protein [Robertkochia solimangrovi]TRZ41949.1 hypothetical protein DMZ48_15025 [Robertkochia solimangrovi]
MKIANFISAGLLATALIFGISCKNPQQKNTETEEQSISMDTLQTQDDDNTMMESNEKFFQGLGTEPFWGLDISENSIRFHSLLDDYKEFITPLPEVIRVADANIRKYRVETELVKMDITIMQQSCSDGMSDNTYDYKVDLSITKSGDGITKEFHGCGFFVADTSLAGEWEAKSILSNPVDPEKSNGKYPSITIDTESRSFSGFAGCNNVRGELFMEQQLLRFTKVVSTRKMCLPGNPEDAFLKALQASTTYDVTEDTLILSNPNGEQLRFEKVK